MNAVDRRKWTVYADGIAELATQWPCDRIRTQFNVEMSDEECEYVWTELQLPTGFFNNLPLFDDTYDENTGIVVNASLFDWGYGYSDARFTIRSHWDPNYYKCYTIHVNTSDNQVCLHGFRCGRQSPLYPEVYRIIFKLQFLHCSILYLMSFNIALSQGQLKLTAAIVCRNKRLLLLLLLLLAPDRAKNKLQEQD
jgi:hypothetical protein